MDGVTRDRSDVPKVDPDATRGREVVAQRSERTRVWERSDGLLEAELSTDPVAFRAWDQSMRLIDPSVHVSPDRPGWLVTGANSWSASFGPSDAGVSVTLPSGRSFSSRPAAFDGTAPARVVAPVRDRDDESVVWYRQVWPGVDLRYTVTASQLKEDVVLTNRPVGPGAVTFEVSGVELDAGWNVVGDPSEPGSGFKVDPALVLGGGERPTRLLAGSAGVSLRARGEIGGEARFLPVSVDVANAGGAEDAPVTEGAVPLARAAVVAPGVSRVEVSVDQGWLHRLSADSFPVVVDPSVSLNAGWWASFRSTDGYACGSPNFSPNSCAVLTSYDPWGSGGYWRGIAGFDFSPMLGQQILDADVNLWLVGGTTTPCWVEAHAASAPNFWGAGAGSALGSVALGSSGSIDITSPMQSWMWAWTQPAIGLTGWEAAPSGCFKSLGANMSVVYNHYPPKPTISASSVGNGARYVAGSPTGAPTIAVDPVVDADGQAVKYWLEVDDQPNVTMSNPGSVARVGWVTGTSLALPADVLEDGRTYYWRAWAWDQLNGTSYSIGDVYSFAFERRLGTAQPSPYDTAGTVSVNLSNGNAVFSWSSRQAAAVGGSMGVSLTYNSVVNPAGSSMAAQAGLPGGWVPSWGTVAVASISAPAGTANVVVRFVDGSSQTFVRSPSGDAWVPDDPYEHDALFERPGGGWTYQDEGGTLSEFDGSGLLQSTITSTDDRKPAALRYVYDGSKLRRIFDPVVSTDVASPSSLRQVQLSYGGESGITNPCPTSGLPAGVAAAPTGKLCRITQVDGSITEIYYDASGRIVRFVSPGSETTDLTWDANNRLAKVRSPLAADAVAAGVRADTDATRYLIAYDGTGRVTSVTAPEPTAGAARPKVDYAYTSATSTEVRVTGALGPSGFTRKVDYDAAGRGVKATTALGQVVETKWKNLNEDVVDWTDTEVSPGAFTRTGTEYDSLGRPWRSWGPDVRSAFGASSISTGTAWGSASSAFSETRYDEGVNGVAATWWQRGHDRSRGEAEHERQLLREHRCGGPVRLAEAGRDRGVGRQLVGAVHRDVDRAHHRFLFVRGVG